jgi:hypothetical protein
MKSNRLPTPSFFSLTLAKREREEELSRTLNKGPAPLWSTGGLLSLGWLIPNSPPCHLGTYALPPGQGHSPPDSVCGKVLPPSWPFTRTLVWARKPGRFAPAASAGIWLEKGRPFSSVEGGEVFLPALSSEKSPPHGAKQIALASGPSQSHIKNWGWASLFLVESENNL